MREDQERKVKKYWSSKLRSLLLACFSYQSPGKDFDHESYLALLSLLPQHFLYVDFNGPWISGHYFLDVLCIAIVTYSFSIGCYLLRKDWAQE